MYHGQLPIKPAPPAAMSKPTLEMMVQLIDAAEAEFGADYTSYAPVVAAREALTKAQSLSAQVSAQAEAASARMAQAGVDYAAGTITADELVQRAATEAMLTEPDQQTQVRAHVQHAAHACRRQGLDGLSAVTEEEWVAPLRPIVARLIEEINAHADALGITAPNQPRPGSRTSLDPWEPTHAELNNTQTRQAWERLQETVAQLDDVHGIADVLREAGFVGTATDRDFREDYRWRDTSVLVGDPSKPAAFWLANRAAGQPGIFTAAELAA